jgi:hypothetical protein
MASQSLQRALTMHPLISRSLGGFIAALLLAGPAASWAEEEASPSETLRPYSAQYKTTARGMALTLTRKLKASKDGSFTLTNGGKIMVVGFHEVSVFTTEGARVVPKSYVYQGTGLINRRREVHFTPGSETIRSLYKDNWYDLPYSEGTLDRMSQQEQLRLALLNDPTPKEDIDIRVADGKRIKDYKLVFVGEEMLDTPLGKQRTLHFERLHDDPDRKSDTWVAPDLDYLMVKTLHVEDGKPVEVTLQSADIKGLEK